MRTFNKTHKDDGFIKVVNVNIPFPIKKYEIIYADPPWSYNDKMSNHSFSLDHEYETQDINWIKNLPVKDITEKNCCLFIWVVSPMLKEGIEVLESWGFKFKTIAFCWSKYSESGKEIHNLGRWTMGNIELCLLGVKGKPNSWRQCNNIKQLIKAKRTKHSAKPLEIRKRIVDLLGVNRSRIELFSRSRSNGWDSWGNEEEQFNN